MAFIPYLNFDGTTREALTRYQEIFGGELMIMTGADAPPADEQSGDGVPPEMADMIIHAALTVGDSVLMASDAPPGAAVVVQGTYVNHTADDAVEARRVYDALMEGGEAEMPFEATFFSSGFGVLRDRFGTLWIVDTSDPDQS